MLEIAGAVAEFAGRRVLHGVDLRVGAGEIVAMIGHNGAGKTTLLRAAMGLVRLSAGRITALGEDLRAGATAAISRAGMAFVPQGRNVFRPLSVAENFAIARTHARPGALPEAEIDALFPALLEKRAASAGSLSGGQQQMLALASALLRGPRLILLDEPSTGLAPLLVQELFAAVVTLRRQHGISFLIVDQNVPSLLGVASRAYVLKSGRIAYAGDSAGLAESATLWSLF